MKTRLILRRLLGALCVLSITADAADLHVPADHATIQAAIDAAADGDTIHIAAGVYQGDSLSPDGTARIIRKNNLTLVGQPGTILRAVPNMAAAIEGDILWRCVLFIHLSPNIVLENLAFEGDQLGNQQERGMIGAYYLDSGGTVENCRFTGFRERVPGPASWDAWGLRFINDLPGAPLYEARAIGNTVEDCYGGITVWGATDVTSYNFLLRDNKVSGVGPTPKDGELRGIELSWRVSGSVENNTICNFSYEGEGAEFPFGHGLLAIGAGWPDSLAPLDPIRIEGNTFRDNNLHMTVFKASDQCPIVNNRIEGTAPTNRPVGLWISGQSVPVRGNDFRDLETGIRLAGEDPEFGKLLGCASDVQVEGNRFTDVGDPISYQPLASATETDNLEAPFPEPELKVERAVMLSWPSYYEDWSLQISGDLENWTLLDLPVMQEDGRSIVTVPADQPHQFFRLVESDNPE